jgi:hypothetical protein
LRAHLQKMSLQRARTLISAHLLMDLLARAR